MNLSRHCAGLLNSTIRLVQDDKQALIFAGLQVALDMPFFRSSVGTLLLPLPAGKGSRSVPTELRKKGISRATCSPANINACLSSCTSRIVLFNSPAQCLDRFIMHKVYCTTSKAAA